MATIIIAIAIIAAVTAFFIALILQWTTSYCAQTTLLRYLFRPKNKARTPESDETIRLQSVRYESVFGNDELDVYCTANTSVARPLLLWVHGGGFVSGDKRNAEPWARAIAEKTGIVTACMNYLPAPKQHYPVPLLQVTEALRFLLLNAARYNIDKNCIFLAGDSAGAQIASQYAAIVTNPALQQSMHIYPPFQPLIPIRGVILCCGLYDMDTVIKTHFPTVKTFLWIYTDTKNIRTFARKNEMSTVKNITPDYPDAYVTCGNADPLLPQTYELLAALREKNVSVTPVLWSKTAKKLGHEYQFRLGTPAADYALKKAADFIIRRIDS